MNLSSVVRLTRLDKPIGIYLLLWPTLTALWIASSGLPSLKLLAIFILGVVLTRSAGCVINDLADKDFDKSVARTKERPLATGEVSKKSALILFGVLIGAAFLLVLQTNLNTVLLSLAALALLSVYPLMKRITHAPQFILGLAFAWAIPMAFSATEAGFSLGIIWLMIATIAWAVVYDTMYAMVDFDDDIKIGVKSTAILFHPNEILWIGVFQVIMLISLIATGVSFGLGLWYYAGVLVAAVLMVYHQWLIKDKVRDKCFYAFRHNHYIGLVVLIATMASSLF
jgi:4-hydroxybenzoate polyprenyltransferase